MKNIQQTLITRIAAHQGYALSKIDRDIDKEVFVESIHKFYDSSVFLLNDENSFWDFYRLVVKLETEPKDYFWYGRRKTMSILAKELFRQVAISELKKGGYDVQAS